MVLCSFICANVWSRIVLGSGPWLLLCWHLVFLGLSLLLLSNPLFFFLCHLSSRFVVWPSPRCLLVVAGCVKWLSMGFCQVLDIRIRDWCVGWSVTSVQQRCWFWSEICDPVFCCIPAILVLINLWSLLLPLYTYCSTGWLLHCFYLVLRVLWGELPLHLQFLIHTYSFQCFNRFIWGLMSCSVCLRWGRYITRCTLGDMYNFGIGMHDAESCSQDYMSLRCQGCHRGCLFWVFVVIFWIFWGQMWSFLVVLREAEQ